MDKITQFLVWSDKLYCLTETGMIYEYDGKKWIAVTLPSSLGGNIKHYATD